MKRQQKSSKPLRSFNEYLERFFPDSYKKQNAVTDPKELGRILVRETFEKFRPILKETE